MGVLTYDIETQGRNSHAFILGAVTNEKENTKIFYDKRQMWLYIINYAEKEARRGHNTYAYAHNAKFDYYGIRDLNDSKIKKSGKGFSYQRGILTFKEGKEVWKRLYFLDTWKLYPDSLESIGEFVGAKKTQIPEKLTIENEAQEYSKQELEEIGKYCANDAIVLMQFIKRLKKELLEQGMGARRLISIGQIAISHFFNHTAKKPYWERILKPKINKRTKRQQGWFVFSTKKSEITHKAYRGGRVEAFKTGQFEGCYSYDIKSYYPSLAKEIKFPDLRSEYKVIEPLKNWTIQELLKKSGASKVIIEKKAQEIGQVPVRYNVDAEKGTQHQIFPKQACKIIGTYAHEELAEFIKEGHKILDIEESVIYDNLIENPLSEIMDNWFELRKKSEFTNAYYKMMMNHLIGKFAYMVEKIDEKPATAKEENWKQYTKEGYQHTDTIGENLRIYTKTIEKKPSYCYNPIICAKVNALGRIKLFNTLKEVGAKSLLYCDTDGFVAIGNQESKLKLENKLGGWRSEYENSQTKVWGQKNYAIATEYKLAGIPKKDITKEQVEQEIIKYKRMLTDDTAPKEKAGLFTDETRDLRETRRKDTMRGKEIENQRAFIDEKEKDQIGYFLKKGLLN